MGGEETGELLVDIEPQLAADLAGIEIDVVQRFARGGIEPRSIRAIVTASGASFRTMGPANRRGLSPCRPTECTSVEPAMAMWARSPLGSTVTEEMFSVLAVFVLAVFVLVVFVLVVLDPLSREIRWVLRVEYKQDVSGRNQQPTGVGRQHGGPFAGLTARGKVLLPIVAKGCSGSKPARRCR